MAQLQAISSSSSPNFIFYGPKQDPFLHPDKVFCSKKLPSFQELGARASELYGHTIVHSNGNLTKACSNKAIQAVLSSEKETVASSAGSGGVLRKKLNKVVLAYSGGLDTSVIVPWLRENYGCEVVCFTADVGQGVSELKGLEEKAKASGACQLVVKDLREEFVKDYIYPCLRAGAIYERKYLLGTSMARPVIAKAMVDVAREVGADAVSHGCTGKGNDQVRFELTFFALNPELNVVAPWREWEIRGREDAIEYAKKHNVPVPVTKKSIYSRDRNLWHLSHEGDILEDPAKEPNKDMYMMTVEPEDAPNQPEYVQIGMVSGLPVSVNGKEFSPASLLSELNEIGGEISNMVKNEDSGSPSWSASLFMQTTEDVARAVAAAAAAATTVRSPRPSVVFSSKDDNGNSPLHKLQHQVSRVLKGFSQPHEVKSGTYNPEVLTSQKRQWASVQLQSLDHRPLKEPSRLFESMVVVGLHPNCDIQALQKQYFGRKSEGSGKFRSAFSGQHQSRVEPNLEPQVLFVYPPEKQLPLKYKDLLSFCFPGGVEVHAIEKTSSMSELNEILLGQDHLKQSDLSFVFRLQVADDSTLYGCCVLVEEIVQKPSGLISMISDGQPPRSGSRRHMLTTRRCYCILSRFPFFELHFSVLKSIFTEERLERLTKGISDLDLESSEGHGKKENLKENSDGISSEDRANDVLNGTVDTSQLSPNDSLSEKVMDDVCHMEHQMLKNNHLLKRDMNGSGVVPVDPAIEKLPDKRENGVTSEISEAGDTHVDDFVTNKQLVERRFPNAVLPLLRYQQYESSESSSSFQGSPSEDRIFRSDVDEVETEEASFSGQEYSSDHSDILDWAKGNNHGSLQIICEYYRLPIPARGSTITFHPLEHLHPLEFHRPDETVLHIAGSTIDLKSCSSSLELAEAHSALMAEEEAKSLSVWAVALLCGSLRLENVLTLFAGALLEKQIVVISSNLGILSALVLSIIPLIRPYQWQSLLMPVLPNDMLDFLDAPVPYVVGVKNKTTEVQSKLTNAILVDANKNQVRSPTIPQLPQQKELYSYLIPYHAKLVGESFLGRKRPVYECTDAQVEAAKGFLGVLRSYLDSLCSNLRSHTITNVQSNDDKVSLLLKESFLESFPSRDRPFMKHFVDTQLFSVHTDLVLSFFQKE